jgi:hypothetical protein
MPEHDADLFVERMKWALEDAQRQQQAIHAHDGGSAAAAPARSVRRATARRASIRGATARDRARPSGRPRGEHHRVSRSPPGEHRG